jgi:hypothetical protein
VVFGLAVLLVPLAAGAGVCAAKVNGVVATASAMASKLFFIFFSPLGFCPLQFHIAPDGRERR